MIDYILECGTKARNSYSEVFQIGELVTHKDKNVGSVIIERFEWDLESNEESSEVKVHTNKGWSHLTFIEKINTATNMKSLYFMACVVILVAAYVFYLSFLCLIKS